MLFLLYYTTFSTVLQYKFPEFFVNITNHRAERKDKRENRREEVRLRRGLIENERFTAPLCKGDLRVCEARLQASPRGVVKKQSLTACGGAPFTQGSLKTPHILLDNRSFFCLLFFSKKSTVKEKYGQRKVRAKKSRGNKRAGRGIPVRLICPAGDAGTGYWEMASIGLRDCRSSFLHNYFTPFTH